MFSKSVKCDTIIPKALMSVCSITAGILDSTTSGTYEQQGSATLCFSYGYMPVLLFQLSSHLDSCITPHPGCGSQLQAHWFPPMM